MLAFHHQLVTLTPSNALAEIQRVKIGEVCVRRMIQSRVFAPQACSGDLEYLRLLAHFVIAERFEDGLRNAVIERLRNDFPETRKQNIANVSAQLGWYSRLSGCLIDAKFKRDLNCSADPALECYNRFRGLRANIMQAKALSIAPSAVRIMRVVHMADPSRTDPELYNLCLTDFLARGRMSPVSLGLPNSSETDLFDFHQFEKATHSFAIAKLLLYHPSSPQPDMLLAIFRSIETNPDDRSFRPKSADEGVYRYRLAEELAAVLRHLGRTEDADWASQFSQKLYDIADRTGKSGQIVATDKRPKPSTRPNLQAPGGSPRQSSRSA